MEFNTIISDQIVTGITNNELELEEDIYAQTQIYINTVNTLINNLDTIYNGYVQPPEDILPEDLLREYLQYEDGNVGHYVYEPYIWDRDFGHRELETDFPLDQPIENMNLPTDFLEPVNIRLSKEEFKNLHVKIMSKKLVSELNINDKTCVICQDEINIQCHCIILNCGHLFHKKCVELWLTKHCEKPICPMCRKDVR